MIPTNSLVIPVYGNEAGIDALLVGYTSFQRPWMMTLRSSLSSMAVLIAVLIDCVKGFQTSASRLSYLPWRATSARSLRSVPDLVLHTAGRSL